MANEQTAVEPEEAEQTAIERLAAPGNFISRVIEYLPTGGVIVAKDCTNAGLTYSKGAVVTMSDGNDYSCSGDKEGTWKKVKKS